MWLNKLWQTLSPQTEFINLGDASKPHLQNYNSSIYIIYPISLSCPLTVRQERMGLPQPERIKPEKKVFKKRERTEPESKPPAKKETPKVRYH